MEAKGERVYSDFDYLGVLCFAVWFAGVGCHRLQQSAATAIRQMVVIGEAGVDGLIGRTIGPTD